VDAFSQWLGVDKDTGKIFADGSNLPIENVRRWSVQDARDFPNASLNLPADRVLVAPLDPQATYCFSVDRKEAERARLLPAQ
jgi:hypothetical protein